MHVWQAVPMLRNWAFAFANFQGVQTVVKDFGRDSEDPRAIHLLTLEPSLSWLLSECCSPEVVGSFSYTAVAAPLDSGRF